jgi:uncharacterized repeat protein (TIGR03803 family)
MLIYDGERNALVRKGYRVKHLRNLLCACLSAALLAACGGGSNNGLPSSTPMSGAQPRKAGREKVIYSFQGLPDMDGANPQAGLIAVSGVLYGTTNEGGKDTKDCNEYTGCGTVFEVSTSGSESVLYRFEGGSDGVNPYAGLAAVDGILYGTTIEGGSCGPSCGNDGTVFEVTPSGAESVLYTFKGSNSGDGGLPSADLIALNGVLYGTTTQGGSCCFGTVFEISTSGSESVLHSFAGGGEGQGIDGGYPFTGLTVANGELYGTTAGGGGTPCGEAGFSGCGAIFKINTSGKERVLYRFRGGNDGAFPWANLTLVNGKLYGTTSAGGSGSYGSSGEEGTIFEVSTSGKERVLHRFTGGTDGWGPLSGPLVAVNKTLYGTTTNGGGSGCNGYGCGTIFKISTSGNGYRVLYSFKGGTDGARPYSGLISVNGGLYGTTSVGGNSTGCYLNGNNGCGTVFEFMP